MNNDYTQFVATLLKRLAKMNYIKPGEVPNIDLYMDQVTTFMDEHLSDCKRREDDKILTKTMINNYTKNNLLPPPVKKKYSKEHVLVMIFIYYFKNILSIKDIETLLAPLTDNYFDTTGNLTFTDIYKDICDLEKSRITDLMKDVTKSYQCALETFEDMPEEERAKLQTFAFLCNLSFDVYVKKQIIEKLIDGLPKPESDKKKK